MAMAIARLLALVLLVVAMPALAADPHPPQLAVSFLAEPAPIVQDGSTRLVYEMQIVNYTKSAYLLDAVEVKAAETAATFRGPALEGMIRRFGLQGEPAGAANRTIEPGRGAIVFLMLDLGKAQAPPTIAHSLSVLDDNGEAHEMPLAPLAVSSERPIVVGAPLRAMDRWRFGEQRAGRRPSPRRIDPQRASLHFAALRHRLGAGPNDWRRDHDVEGSRGQERELFLLRSADL
jgi:hypothetical protein